MNQYRGLHKALATTTAIGMAEAKTTFKSVMARAQTTGRPAATLKSNKPREAIAPMDALVERNPASAAVVHTDERTGMLEKLA